MTGKADEKKRKQRFIKTELLALDQQPLVHIKKFEQPLNTAKLIILFENIIL